jgi:flagellar biosynthesis protein FlhB
MSSEGNSSDKEDKTESPTEHKLTQTKEKGDFPVSKDLSLCMMLFASSICLFLVFPYLSTNLIMKLRGLIENAHTFNFTSHHKSEISFSILKSIFPHYILLSIIFIIAALAITYIQTRFVMKAIQPNLNKISPLKGFKRIFSLNALVDFLKSLLKLFTIGGIIYILIYEDITRLAYSSGQPILASLKMLWSICFKLFMAALLFQFCIGIADYFYQQYEYKKKLRMTKQETKDEMKDIDGDPLIKGKRRQLQRSHAKNRMMEQVQEATVVITNPTHFAIALKYTPSKNNAPIVVAKGKGFVAKRIRELALKNSVQIVPNPPLARSLYKLPLNKEIPVEFYKAVAEIIRYVFKNRKGK